MNHFYSLTPDRVLQAVEKSGVLCTGRCMALNSFENRVYDVEVEVEDAALPKHSPQRRRVVKFYRPGRWTQEQILEEHRFLEDLREAEIPVVCPSPFEDGSTLQFTADGIAFALFPKVGGRAPEELGEEQLLRVGRLLARLHAVGVKRPAPNRVRMSVESHGLGPLKMLLDGNWIPMEFVRRYQAVIETICQKVEPWLSAAPAQRIHGDCHLGNLLSNESGLFFLDFDDMMTGPTVQDLWLVIPGRDADAIQKRNFLLEGYREFYSFRESDLKWIEALRALRMNHYAAWLARRWEDPAFPLAFPQFGSNSYWNGLVADLEEQNRWVE